MAMRMKPKVFTPDEMATLREETTTQAPSNKIEKSADKNFPAFEVPVNDKVLVYVPNFTRVNPETGLEELIMDKPWLHPVKDGKRFSKIRCIKDITAGGYDGTCPVCEGTDEPWELANRQIESLCKNKGLNPKDPDDVIVKSIKKEAYSARVIDGTDRFLTFPIVVIEAEDADVRKIVPNDDKTAPKHQIMWYTIRESSFIEKWGAALEAIEEDEKVLHPGGRMFILNFTYPAEGNEHTKMLSAKALKVMHRSTKAIADYIPLFDEEAKEWTPEKAMTTLYENMFYEKDELQKEVDRLLVSTRDSLNMFKKGDSNAGQIGANMTSAPTLAPPIDDSDDVGVVLDGYVD